MYNTYSCRKICRAGIAVRVEEEEGLVHALKPTSVQCPVNYVVMLLGRGHVIDILSVILTSYGFPHTHELPCVYMSHTVAGGIIITFAKEILGLITG